MKGGFTNRDKRPHCYRGPTLTRSEPPSSSGLGRRPFTPVTRVRIPLGVRRRYGSSRTTWSCGAVWSARRPVKPEVAGSNPVRTANLTGSSEQVRRGRVAQLEEHSPEKRGVPGSTPGPTTYRGPPHGRASPRSCFFSAVQHVITTEGRGTPCEASELPKIQPNVISHCLDPLLHVGPTRRGSLGPVGDDPQQEDDLMSPAA